MQTVKSSTQRIIDRIVELSQKGEVDKAIELFRSKGYIQFEGSVKRPSKVVHRLVFDSIRAQGLEESIHPSIMQSILILCR